MSLAFGRGVLNLRRRRRRLYRELKAVDEAYAQHRNDPSACEAALAQRRAIVSGLLLEGKLEEAQVALVEKRIDDLARTLGIGAIEGRLDFLPHGMVRTLQGMLQDGQISNWERDHFMTALYRDRLLTLPQKRKV